MGVLVRILKVPVGLIVAFGGYFIMAAVGWPEPFEDMRLERNVIGGLILLFGILISLSAFRGKPRRKAAARPAAAHPAPEPVGHHDPFSLSGHAAEAAPVAAAAVAVAAVEEAAHHVQAEPVAETAHEPVAEPAHEPAPEAAHAPAPEPAHAPPVANANAPKDLAGLLAAGDKLVGEGRQEDALEPYTRALDMARAAHAAHPHDAAATRVLAGALKSNADVYDEQGRLDTALDLYEEAVKLNRGLAADGAASDRRALSLAIERLADCRESRGHRSRALDLYRESLGIAEGLAQAEPGNDLYAEDLAVTRRRIDELEGAATSA